MAERFQNHSVYHSMYAVCTYTCNDVIYTCCDDVCMYRYTCSVNIMIVVQNMLCCVTAYKTVHGHGNGNTSHHITHVTMSHISPRHTCHHVTHLTTSHITPRHTFHHVTHLTTSQISPRHTFHHVTHLTMSYICYTNCHHYLLTSFHNNFHSVKITSKMYMYV